MDFAVSWSVHQTLFTNCRVEGGSNNDEVVSEQVYGEVLPRVGQSTDGVMGGLSKIVYLDTTGIENPFVEYKGPDLNIEMPVKVFSQWVKEYAADWSVRIKAEGEGTANSGFQVVVEEIDNLELRQQRSRMMENGLQRMFKSVREVWNFHHAGTFSDNTTLFVTFNDPILPTDTKSEEETWNLRIDSNRASKIDYFMQTKGMSRDEAEMKVSEIEDYKNSQPSVEEE